MEAIKTKLTYVGNYLDGSVGYHRAKHSHDTEYCIAKGQIPLWLHVCYAIASRVVGFFEAQIAVRCISQVEETEEDRHG